MFAVAALCQRRNFVGHRPTLQARHGLNRLFERFHPFPPNCHFLSTGSSRGRSDPVFDRFSIINGRPRLFPTKLPPFPAFRRASLIVRPHSRIVRRASRPVLPPFPLRSTPFPVGPSRFPNAPSAFPMQVSGTNAPAFHFPHGPLHHPHFSRNRNARTRMTTKKQFESRRHHIVRHFDIAGQSIRPLR
jgi:hypothetical protein